MTPKQVRLIKPTEGHDIGTVFDVAGWNPQVSPPMPKVETRGGPKYLFSGEWEPVRPEWVRLTITSWGLDSGELLEVDRWSGEVPVVVIEGVNVYLPRDEWADRWE